MDEIRKVRSGCKDSFEKIYLRYHKQLYSFIYKKTGCEFYAKEVVQITFLKLWENRSSLKNNIPIAAQLFRIAKTTLIDALRKIEKQQNRDTKYMQIASGENNNTAYDILVTKDLKDILLHISENMPPMRRKVFQLKVDNQLSYKEISELLCISVKTVNKHMELAMQNIRPFLKHLSLFFGSIWSFFF